MSPLHFQKFGVKGGGLTNNFLWYAKLFSLWAHIIIIKTNRKDHPHYHFLYFYYLRPLLVPLSYSRRIDPLLTPYLLPSLDYLHLLPLLTSLGVVHVLRSKKRGDQGNTQSIAMYYERGYSGSALKVALPMFYGKGYRGSAPEVYHSRGYIWQYVHPKGGGLYFWTKK